MKPPADHSSNRCSGLALAGRVAALAGLALLGACAGSPPSSSTASTVTSPSTPRYTSVTAGPSARLILRTKLEGTATLYGVNVLANSDDCSQRQTVGAAKAGVAALPTVALAAGRIATVEFVGVNADKKVCLVRWSFTPMAGQAYLLQSTFDGTRCTSSVLNATDPDAIRVEAGALRRNPMPDKVCVPLGQARAITPVPGAGRGDATLSPGADASELKGLIAP
jgi:hypothetical protein